MSILLDIASLLIGIVIALAIIICVFGLLIAALPKFDAPPRIPPHAKFQPRSDYNDW